MNRLIGLTLILGLACGGTSTPPDAEDAIAVPGGKADEAGYTDCELAAVVEHLNDPSTSVEALKANGVHTRAARNLIEHRDGPDGVSGTADDDTFDGIIEVDDVSWVGPVAISQLVASVDGRCMDGDQNVEVIFSPQPRDASHLTAVVKLIEGATRSLDIAMYSYRDAAIGDALADAVRRGVSVRMIFESGNADRRDPDGSKSEALEEIGVDVRYVNKIMHHKYVIVDGPRDSATFDGILATGSANWSNSAATRYDENTVIFRDNPELLLRYQREYEHLWANSRDFDNGAGIVSIPAFEIDDSVIEAMDGDDVDAYFTSANFRTWVSSRNGPTFSVIRGENEVADQIVALIRGATESIRIASGHLRSRPVATALAEAAAANPDLDIRVYLDAQEFVSEYTHERQIDDREDCLVAAVGSDARTQDCYDKGFLYGYQMVLEGIDVRFKYYSYRWHYSYAAQMHHKYVIIDSDTVLTGSYNLSDNAEHNTMENVVVFRAPEHRVAVQRFVDNFEAMWETGRDAGLYDALLDDVQTGTDSFPIVFDSMALTWDEVDVLKRAMRDACPDINSLAYRQSPERYRVCDPS